MYIAYLNKVLLLDYNMLTVTRLTCFDKQVKSLNEDGQLYHSMSYCLREVLNFVGKIKFVCEVGC